MNKPHLRVDPSVKALVVFSQETNGATFCKGHILAFYSFLKRFKTIINLCNHSQEPRQVGYVLIYSLENENLPESSRTYQI